MIHESAPYVDTVTGVLDLGDILQEDPPRLFIQNNPAISFDVHVGQDSERCGKRHLTYLDLVTGGIYLNVLKDLDQLTLLRVDSDVDSLLSIYLVPVFRVGLL